MGLGAQMAREGRVPHGAQIANLPHIGAGNLRKNLHKKLRNFVFQQAKRLIVIDLMDPQGLLGFCRAGLLPIGLAAVAPVGPFAPAGGGFRVVRSRVPSQSISNIGGRGELPHWRMG